MGKTLRTATLVSLSLMLGAIACWPSATADDTIEMTEAVQIETAGWA